MTAMEAIMPTHAALATGVRPSSAAASAQPSTVPAELPIRKYIIMASGDGQEQVLLFSRDIAHIDALPHNRIAISAGYCVVTGDSRVMMLDFPSETLRLYPRKSDKEILQQFIGHP